MRGIGLGINAFSRSATRALEGPAKLMDRLHGGMSSLAKGVAAAGAVAAVGLGVAAAPGLEYQRTLASLNAVAKPTVAGLQELSDKALQVGEDFGFSAIEVLKAEEAMSKQGLTAQQTLAGIGGVAAAAAADGSAIDQTMGGLLATMAGMGKGAGDLQHIADVMAKAGDATAASIGTLSESMAVFGPTAKSLGIDIESAVGQLAVLQDAGLDASSAGTTLSAVYSKLASPTKETSEALERLGLSIQDATTGNLKKPQQLMDEVFLATQGIKGNVGQMAAFTDLVGLNSQKALLNLAAAAGSGKLEKVMSGLTEGVDGYATSIAKLKQDSAAGDLDRLGASFEGLRIELTQVVSGPLRPVVQGFRDWTAANKDLIASNTGAFVSGLVTNLPQIGTWMVRIGTGVGVFYGVRAAIWGVTTATEAWAIATGQVTLAEAKNTTAMVIGTGANWAKSAANWAVSGSTWAYNAASVALQGTTAFVTGLEIRGTAMRWARNAANWAVQASTWAYNTAVGASQALITPVTVAEVAGTVAKWGSNAANWAVQASTWAYNTASGAAVGTIGTLKGLEIGSTAAKWGTNAANWAVQASTWAYNAAVGTTTGLVASATGAFWASVPAIWAAAAPLAPLLATVTGLTVAVGALVAAWRGLNGELAGSGGITGTVSKMWEMGTFDPFAAHDAVLNDKARADAAQRDAGRQVVGPEAAISRQIQESRHSETATVEIHSKVPATMTKTARGVKLRAPAPSGAF